MKRLLALVLAMVMAVFCIPAMAEETSSRLTEEEVTFTLELLKILRFRSVKTCLLGMKRPVLPAFG